jgi:hypothetical protein
MIFYVDYYASSGCCKFFAGVPTGKNAPANFLQASRRAKSLFRSGAQSPKTTKRTPKRDAPCVYCLKYLLKHVTEEIFLPPEVFLSDFLFLCAFFERAGG